MPPQSSDAWSLKQGLAAQYAAQAGLDPNLGAAAGEAGWDVLKALRDAVDATDPKQQRKLVRRANARLAKSSLGRHRELVQSIRSRLAELDGEGPLVNPGTGLQEFNSVFFDSDASGPPTSTVQATPDRRRCLDLAQQRDRLQEELQNVEDRIRELLPSSIDRRLPDDQRQAVQRELTELNTRKSNLESEIRAVTRFLERLGCEVLV